MGFSTTIYTTFDTGQGSNFLNGRGNLPALSTISANTQGASAVTPAIKILPGTSGQLSAYLLNYYFAQTVYNGSPTYISNQNGIFTYQDGSNTYPYLLYINQGNSSYSTVDWYLSATGQICASGLQTGVIYWTLSSTALSATSAGVIPVAVNNPTISFDGVTSYPYVSAATNVFCVNTPFPSDNPVYICQDEFSRIQQFLG